MGPYHERDFAQGGFRCRAVFHLRNRRAAAETAEFAVATALTLALALSACGTYWDRQNTDVFNSGSRLLSMGASDFSKATLQITIPTPDGAVVGAVNLSRDDTELYVTEGSNSGFKPYGFAIFNRATGKKRCATLLQGIQMWSSPTGGNSDDVFIAGGSGNIWRFSTKIGNNKDCALEPGWPVQTKNNLTITGPVLVLGDDRVIAAAQDGHVAMFKYDNPVSPAPGFDVKSKSLVGPMNGSDLEGWEIVGSPALAAVQDQNGTRKTLLLLSISTSKAGALVGVDVDAQTLAGMFQTGPLEAGPSVGFIDPFTHIAVVPELKLIVHGIRIDNIKWTSWDANLAGQMQQGDQFKTEASVTNGNVFLTSPSSLIGLDLVTGHQANWSPALLDSSPVSAPAVADNGNIYLAVGSSVEAFNSSTGAMIKAIPVNAQGVLVRPSIAQDGSVLVGDTQNIFEFR